MDKNELEHAEPAEPTSNNAIEQMVLDEEDSPPSGTFQMLASQWVWQCTKSVSIPAEEQNAGRAVDYFYRMEFHITPRFFSDSNYLFSGHFFPDRSALPTFPLRALRDFVRPDFNLPTIKIIFFVVVSQLFFFLDFQKSVRAQDTKQYF